jgi:MFS family permease
MQLSRRKVLFALGVILAINTMNFFDRQIPGAVAEPLRKELVMNDKDLGKLNVAFTILYAIVGVPLGRWADVGQRKRVLAFGVTLWSVFTALSGFARDFWSLFAMRMGVGIGEASCAPAANSLIGDFVPRERRARAVSIFMLGLPLGLALSSVVSGNIGDWNWRVAFFIACAPGLILGALSLLIVEPVRGAAETHLVGASRREGSPLMLVFRIPTMWWIILSGILHNFNAYTIGAFLSPYLQRYHGLTTGQAGWVSGLFYGCGGLGILLGGWACDRSVRTRISGRLEVSSLAMLLGVPCMYVALQQSPGDLWSFAAWMVPGFMMFYVYYAGVYTTIQEIVEPSLRGTAMAMYFFAFYLLGAAQGPLFTGWISDRVAERLAGSAATAMEIEQAKALGLHQALSFVPLIGAALVIVLFAASRTVKKDYDKLHKWMEASGGGNTNQ